MKEKNGNYKTQLEWTTSKDDLTCRDCLASGVGEGPLAKAAGKTTRRPARLISEAMLLTENKEKSVATLSRLGDLNSLGAAGGGTWLPVDMPFLKGVSKSDQLMN